MTRQRARSSAAAGFAWLAVLLLGPVLIGRFFEVHDWEWGRQRCALLAAAAVLVLVARPSASAFLRSRAAAAVLWAAALVALGLDARSGLQSVSLAASTGEIRLDQGQNTLRAARLLLRGEDPYAQGQLLDLEAWFTRAPQRAQAGLVTLHPRFAHGLAGRWWSSLDPSARAALVPPAPAGNAAAARERSLYGYKYGPLLPLLTAPAQALAGAAAVPALQLFWWAALLVLLALCLRAGAADPAVVALVLLCLSLEPNLARNALYYSASDIWALALMAGALLAFLHRRPVALGLCVAAAVSCKLLPSLLLLPMLFVQERRGRLTAPLVACAGVVALFGPFVAADPAGFWANVVIWPSAMQPDNTHWSFYASAAVRSAVRAFCGLAIAAGAVALVARQRRMPAGWFRYLAASSAALVLGGVAFHNNYVPWFTVWALGSASAIAQAPAASGNR
ncbi:MAG TPA: glycosyltransferase 87 family protein [Myxococcales bacterium]|nr:glycosyltransferase 87 family protein [Myxococcales bacterium]